ncbi:ATP/GTP-binding protein [Candidatus Woesearchaeota archaeon]|nr:ATP/GTP-binding protein [Candidatus Woesearchaeota archaeon]
MHQTIQVDWYKKVLTEFNARGIQYCLLRNYEFLYDDSFPIEGLDMVVSKPDLVRVGEVLHNFGFMKRKQQFSLMHKAYFKLVDLKQVSFDLQVGGVYWNDMRYLEESILKNRIAKDFFFVLSENDAAVMYVAHSILGKRYFKSKYQRIISSMKYDRNEVLAALSSIFNRRKAATILDLVEQQKFERIPTYSLAAYFVMKKLGHITTFLALCGRWLGWKKFFTPAPLISVLGPDGAGKSTLVSSLQEHLEVKGRRVKVVYTGRGRNHLLPITKIGRAYKKTEKRKMALSPSPAAAAKSLFLKKLLYTASAPVFFFDQLLRYYARIFPARMQKKIVITDRYGSDIMLMKNVPFGFKRFLLWFLPKPPLTIFLYNTPEVLKERRPQENIDDLKKQLEIFNRFTYSLKLQTSGKEKRNLQALEFVESYLLRNWW